MATYVSPMIEEIADYTDTTRGYYVGWADAFGGGFAGTPCPGGESVALLSAAKPSRGGIGRRKLSAAEARLREGCGRAPRRRTPTFF